MCGKTTKNTLHQYRELQFTAHTPLNKNQVQVQFRGVFNGEPVVWDATISNLKAVAGTRSNRQSITIAHDRGIHYKIDIELDVEIITEATIFKTMLMIHNYKRINIGRHEFGPPHSTT
jgi:hypothetical protein